MIEVTEALLPPAEEENDEAEEEAPKLALVGRPNVGKSSLVNAVLEDKRTTVSEIAGTTRDTIDVETTREGRRYIFCDTAGIRHRSRHNTSVEVFSVMRSEEAIRMADVCVLVIDAQSGVTEQDKRIAGLVQKARKAVVIAVNKADLLPAESKKRDGLKEQL